VAAGGLGLTASIEFDAAFVKAFDALTHPQRAFTRGLRAIGRTVQGRARANYLSGPRPKRLGRRSGVLARSVLLDDGGLPYYVEVGTALPYGPVHEFGARIKARGVGPMIYGLGINGKAPFRSAREVTIPARPFLAPALDDTIPKMAGIMGVEIARSMGQGFEVNAP